MNALYRLDFSSGRSYIGITTQSPKQRFRRHAWAVRTGESNILYRAWRKYGPPVMMTLAILEKNMLLDVERRAIQAFGTLNPHGYNMTPGGDFNPMSDPDIRLKISGDKASSKRPEVRAKISASAKLRRGFRHSDETKAKIAAAGRLRVMSQTQRDHLSIVRTGRKASEETRAKMSLSQTGRKSSESTRAKIAAALRGKSFTLERCANISAGKLASRIDQVEKLRAGWR